MRHHGQRRLRRPPPKTDPFGRQDASATYNGTLYGQYGEWVTDSGAGTYINSDFHHNGAEIALDFLGELWCLVGWTDFDGWRGWRVVGGDCLRQGGL